MNPKENFRNYLYKAKFLTEKARIPNFEKYFEAGKFKDDLLGNLENVLFVIDLRINEFIYLSPNTYEVEGYHKEFLLKLTPNNYFNIVHPTDAEIVINKIFPDGMNFVAENRANIDFTKMKISYNYRLKQPNDSYKMLLQQFSYIMVDEELNPLVIMGTVSDITDIYEKNELFCRIAIQNNKQKWEKVFERFYPIIDSTSNYSLSAKELEIIRFVSEGKSSKEIASLTNRSIETINTQRKSILKKMNCKSLTEAVLIAKENHWI